MPGLHSQVAVPLEYEYVAKEELNDKEFTVNKLK